MMLGMAVKHSTLIVGTDPTATCAGDAPPQPLNLSATVPGSRNLLVALRRKRAKMSPGLRRAG